MISYCEMAVIIRRLGYDVHPIEYVMVSSEKDLTTQPDTVTLRFCTNSEDRDLTVDGRQLSVGISLGDQVLSLVGLDEQVVMDILAGKGSKVKAAGVNSVSVDREVRAYNDDHFSVRVMVDASGIGVIGTYNKEDYQGRADLLNLG